MSYYISRTKPVFKDWQFHSLSEGVDKEDWLAVADKFDNLQKSSEEGGYRLYSVQNPKFHTYLRQNPNLGNAITLSHFPERFKGEFAKYLKQICDLLHANLYVLNNKGVMEAVSYTHLTLPTKA